MTALAQERTTSFAGAVPSRGTYPIKANVRIWKGALVGLDSAGRAMPADTIANGCLLIVGKASATYDNRTGSDLGGAAAAVDVEVEFGTFDWGNSADADAIAADDVGKLCYAVDDQTVALTSNGGARTVAGIISEVIGTTPWVWSSPVVPAFEDAAAQNAAIDALEAHVVSTSKYMDLQLHSGSGIAAGTPLAAFADGASTTPGVTLVDSKAWGVRWNNHATPAALYKSFSLPDDIDVTANATLVIHASKVGATVGDATKFTITAYNQVVGAVHDADADYGGDTDAMVGDATTKTIQTVSRTLALANLPAVPSSFTIGVKPKDGTLGTDDVIIHSAILYYKGKTLT